jgi:hypothetical protein
VNRDPFPTVSVAPDPHPSGAPFRLDVTCNRGFSADAPAQLAARVENVSGREQTVGFGPAGPVSTVWSDDGRLVLVPTDRSVQRSAFGTDDPVVTDRPIDGCWQPRPDRLIRHDVLRWEHVPAGGHAAAEYALLDYGEPERGAGPVPGDAAPETTAYLPPGDYRFEESYPPPFDGEENWAEFRWGFTVTLEDG